MRMGNHDVQFNCMEKCLGSLFENVMSEKKGGQELLGL